MTNVSGQLGPRLKCQVLETADDRLLPNPQLLINAVQSAATNFIQRSLLRMGDKHPTWRLTTNQYTKRSLLSEANTRRYLLYRSLGESQSRSAIPKLPDYTVSNKYHNLIYLSSVSQRRGWLAGWLVGWLVGSSLSQCLDYKISHQVT